MWELDCEESWVPKNWCFWTVVLEKTLESPLDCKEIQPVHSEGDQPWDFFRRNDAEAETLVLWPPHAKSWLIGKDSDAVRDWGQEEKGTTEDEMAGWYHWLNGRESGWIPGVGDGQGGLGCCDSWGCKKSDTTELLNWTDGSEAGGILPTRGQLTIFKDRFGFRTVWLLAGYWSCFEVSNTGFSPKICAPSSPFVLKFKSVSHIYLLLCASPKKTGHGSELIESYNLHMPTNKTRLKMPMMPNVVLGV